MYTGLIITVAGVLMLVAMAYLMNRVVAVSRDPLVVLPYQSGWQPTEHALSRYHVRWYLATLLFLAFDVEMLFMYPWAVVVGALGTAAILEMFLFLAALFVAVVWAWREGALRWV